MKKKDKHFLIIYDTVDGTSYHLARSYDEALGWCKHEIDGLQNSPTGNPLFNPKDVDDWFNNGTEEPLGCKYGSIQIVPVPLI